MQKLAGPSRRYSGGGQDIAERYHVGKRHMVEIGSMSRFRLGSEEVEDVRNS